MQAKRISTQVGLHEILCKFFLKKDLFLLNSYDFF